MIDLTRLMFDDGASRPAIDHTSENVITFLGKKMRWRYLPASEAPEDSEWLLGFHLYNVERTDIYDLGRFKSNPEVYVNMRFGYVPKNEVSRWRLERGSLVFISLEYVND